MTKKHAHLSVGLAVVDEIAIIGFGVVDTFRPSLEINAAGAVDKHLAEGTILLLDVPFQLFVFVSNIESIFLRGDGLLHIS